MHILIRDDQVENIKTLLRPLVAVPARLDDPAGVIMGGIVSAEEDLHAADRDEIINRATELFCLGSDDDIEIDTDAVFSRGDDGVWVSAWVHVAHHELPGYEEEE